MMKRLAVCLCVLAAVCMTTTTAAPLPRRLLGANAVIAGGGGGVVIGGGIGGRYGGGCYGPNCDRSGILNTLSVLNAQDAVRRATDYGGPYAPFAATQSAQRSAVAAAWGDLGYLANQQTWDAPGTVYGRRRL